MRSCSTQMLDESGCKHSHDSKGKSEVHAFGFQDRIYLTQIYLLRIPTHV